MLEIGTKAPHLNCPDQDGNMHTLEEYRGKKVILYFYPKDNTPGCTKQAMRVRGTVSPDPGEGSCRGRCEQRQRGIPQEV